MQSRQHIDPEAVDVTKQESDGGKGAKEAL